MTDDIYIGSTTQTLSKRIGEHRGTYKRYLNGKFSYITSFKILEQGDVYIELLELCPCDSKIELHKREGELIREMNCVNRNIAGRTQKEYKQDNKEKIKKIDKHYRTVNKEKISKYKKQYQQENKETLSKYYNTKHECECGGCYTNSHKAKHLKTKKHIKYTEQ